MQEGIGSVQVITSDLQHILEIHILTYYLALSIFEMANFMLILKCINGCLDHFHLFFNKIY